MKFEILDPLPTVEAQQHNDGVFETYCGVCTHSSGQLDGETCRYCGGTGRRQLLVLGIEVTIPEFAGRCSLGNIDPQHTGGNPDLAAIEIAWGNYPLPPDDTTLVTIRPDLDSIGAMACFLLRSENPLEGDEKEIDGRVGLIAQADKFARGPWLAPRPLPSAEKPWPDSTAGASDTRELAAIAAAVADHKIPIEQRVKWLKDWLLTGIEPSDYRRTVELERQEMIAALQKGDIKLRIYSSQHLEVEYTSELGISADINLPREVLRNYGGSDIAFVESTHGAATMIGYCLAPIVIALNPQFRLGAGEPHRKFRICQFQLGYVDLKQITSNLNRLEPGWGGSPTIIGSPQGTGSNVSITQIIEVMTKTF